MRCNVATQHLKGTALACQSAAGARQALGYNRRMPALAPSYTVSADFAQNLLWSAQAEGLEVATWLHLLGDAHARDARVPLSMLADIWTSLRTQDADPLLGLRLGRHFRLGRWGMVEFFLLNARTLGEALQHAAGYWRLVVDGDKQVALAPSSHGWRLTISASGHPLSLAHEVDLTYAVQFMRAMLGQSPEGLSIGLATPPPASDIQAAYRAHFGCPVAFGQTCHWLDIPQGLVAQALPNAHPLIMQTVRAQADLQLNMLKRPASVSASVAQLVELGASNLERAASQLGMSARSLQRRLQHEGVSFASLKDEALRRRAQKLLQEPRLSLKEVAYFLGYEERGFHQACVRWFGASPGLWRERWLTAEHERSAACTTP